MFQDLQNTLVIASLQMTTSLPQGEFFNRKLLFDIMGVGGRGSAVGGRGSGVGGRGSGVGGRGSGVGGRGSGVGGRGEFKEFFG